MEIAAVRGKLSKKDKVSMRCTICGVIGWTTMNKLIPRVDEYGSGQLASNSEIPQSSGQNFTPTIVQWMMDLRLNTYYIVYYNMLVV